MAAARTKITPKTGGRRTTVITGMDETVTAAQQNVMDGGCTLHSIGIDNSDSTGGNTKLYIKLYDVISSAWVPGTSKPDLVIPVRVERHDAGTLVQGVEQTHIPTGIVFRNGISIVAVQDDGDGATAGPAASTEPSVYLSTT